jgi:hypothetical protein
MNAPIDRGIHAGRERSGGARVKKPGIPAIYRVPENPDVERLGEFREFVLAHGIRVGDPRTVARRKSYSPPLRERPKSIRSRSGCSRV